MLASAVVVEEQKEFRLGWASIKVDEPFGPADKVAADRTAVSIGNIHEPERKRQTLRVGGAYAEAVFLGNAAVGEAADVASAKGAGELFGYDRRGTVT